MSTHTVRLHRVLRAPPDRVYRAFLDPDAMAKWLPPHGFTGRVHEIDARVGGRFRMSFTHLGNGQSHTFGGEYLELEPGARIVHTDSFDDANLPGEMRVTVTFTAVPSGTELKVVQEGIPAMIPLDGCHLGWQQSLALLAQLVEAEIPG
jgi:uncharacterized protein YndB with AHSA1/START domain